MAPSPKDGAPKDRIDWIADISKTGKLVEMGCDPFTRAPENKAVYTQTEGSGADFADNKISKVAALAPGMQGAGRMFEGILANPDGVKPTNSPASQVLRLVVGMLGMEVHEQPSSWAESWLTFQDQTFASLGLGTRKDPEGKVRKDSDLTQDNPVEWQMRVIDHLRHHVEERTPVMIDGVASEAIAPGHDWGPDFPEHLELAEFALRRITYAVGILQDPEKHDRPILLREYTEEMVHKVAVDLRQWLHQLGDLLGLYHVHLLDLEAERKKLARNIEKNQEKFLTGEEERKTAVRRHDHLHAMWEEEKMKRDAERLLGIKLAGDDAKIYSQHEVDEMYKQWERDYLDPLMAELREMRLAREGLQDKLSGVVKPKHVPVATKHEAPVAAAGMSKANVALMVGCVDAVNERTVDDMMSRCLNKLSRDVAEGGDNLETILKDMNALPYPSEPAEKMKSPPGSEVVVQNNGSRCPTCGNDLSGAPHPAIPCLDAMSKSFEALIAATKECPAANGAEKLGNLAKWAQDSTNIINKSLKEKNQKGEIRWLPAPKWDLGSLKKPQAAAPRPVNNTVVKTVAAAVEGGVDNSDELLAAQEDEFNRRMDAMRKDLEEQLRKAWEAVEREKKKTQEVLEQMAEAAAKADATLAELRKRIKMLEALLREKGLGAQASDAIWGAGLSEFMQGRDVFERLYRDALDRMRRLAESQARFFEETSTDFLRTIGTLVNPNLKLPGLDASRLDSPTSYASIGSQAAYVACVAPRSAGGNHTTGSPREPRKRVDSPGRSHSPPGSPAGSRPSPRPVKSAPGRMPMGDPLSVARLINPAAVQTPPTAMKMQRAETVGRLHTTSTAHGIARAPPQRDAQEVSLSINSASSSMTGFNPGGGDMRRPPSTQQHVALVAAKRQPPPASRGGPFGDGKILPPLECTGRGREGDDRSPPPEARVSTLRGPRIGSPMRDQAKLVKETMGGFVKQDPLLAIGSLRGAGFGPQPPQPPPPSGLMPPGSHGGRPVTHTGAGRMAKHSGATSMPQLAPPRLLVQSVGAAY